ncbi:MAG: flavodoxin family protein [Clostridia bacterium]|nr:flavodoxin family protein [Clostridia bacterium]
MKFLVLNGSPRKEKSNSLGLTHAFLDGAREALAVRGEEAETELLTVSELNVTPCLGCLSCWGRTAGKCVIVGDDVAGILQKIMAADVIIESFPLQFCSLPGPLKTLIDRLLPLLETYRGGNLREGQALHGLRYDMSGKKLVLISTCGYGEIDPMYDAVRIQYDHICGKGNYTPLFCAQGEAFRVPHGARRMTMRLALAKRAGAELVETGGVSADTLAEMAKPMFSQKVFETLLENVFAKGDG